MSLSELKQEYNEALALKKLMSSRHRYEQDNLDTRILDLENIIAHLETEDAQSDDDNKGYWYEDKDGNQCHTWDFEESIGE